LKEQLAEIKTRLESEHETIEYRKDRFEKLQRFIGDEALLRERALKKRDVLSDEVKAARTEHDKNGKEIAELVSELDLLKRITKRGQVVELSRKVANRENKWYISNWGDSEDNAGLEEDFAQRENLDLVALERAYKKAKEVEDIKRGIRREQEKIEELRARLKEAPKKTTAEEAVEGVTPEQEGAPEPLPAGSPPPGWWDKVFG
jgi:hypothetical protein